MISDQTENPMYTPMDVEPVWSTKGSTIRLKKMKCACRGHFFAQNQAQHEKSRRHQRYLNTGEVWVKGGKIAELPGEIRLSQVDAKKQYTAKRASEGLTTRVKTNLSHLTPEEKLKHRRTQKKEWSAKRTQEIREFRQQRLNELRSEAEPVEEAQPIEIVIQD